MSEQNVSAVGDGKETKGIPGLQLRVTYPQYGSVQKAFAQTAKRLRRFGEMSGNAMRAIDSDIPITVPVLDTSGTQPPSSSARRAADQKGLIQFGAKGNAIYALRTGRNTRRQGRRG